MGVQEDFPFGDLCEGSDSRDEPGQALAVGRHPGQPVQVAPGKVHQDGLGQVIEVEPEHEHVGREVPGGPVQELASPHPAVRARDRVREHPEALLGGRAVGLGEPNDPMFDAQAGGQFVRFLEGAGPVAGNALVHTEGHEPNVGALPEVVMGKGQRDR